MKPTPAQSQRHFSRIPFRAGVMLHLHDRTIHVQLLDIAFKGALVHTETPQVLALQEKCRLVLPLADGDTSIEMEGRIAHLEGQNVGIECKEIDISSLSELRRLIELNTGDSELMNRELAHMLAQR
jgi:PilZ domain